MEGRAACLFGPIRLFALQHERLDDFAMVLAAEHENHELGHELAIVARQEGLAPVRRGAI
jgi:hypothetical protein